MEYENTNPEEASNKKRSIRQIPIPASRARKPRQASTPGEYVPPAPVARESEPAAYVPVRAPRAAEETPVRITRPDTAPRAQAAAEDRPYDGYETERPARERFQPFPKGAKRRPKTMYVAVGALVLVVGVAWGATALFSSASVVVDRKAEAAQFSSTTLAFTKDQDYKMLTVTISETSSLAATVEETVSRKASGKITIYNDFDSEEQDLVATTRFRTTDGLIFRIDAPVTVPGNKQSGSDTTPGTAEAVVYADKAGEAYNIGPSQFNVPGFEGTPRYEAFKAVSTTAMTGGFEGTVKTVPEDEKEEEVQRLKDVVLSRVAAEIAAQTPSDSVALPINPTVKFQQPSYVEDGTSVKTTLTATVEVPVVQKSVLAAKLAQATLNGYDGAPVEIADLSKVAFEQVEIEDDQPLQVTVNGTADIVWVVDAEAVKAALAGRSKKDIGAIIASDLKGIEGITPTISPVWKGSFPKDTAKIEVDLRYQTGE